MKRTFAIVAALGVALLVGGCGNDSTPESPEAPDETSSAASTSGRPDYPSIGATVTNGSAAITINSASEADSISFALESWTDRYEEKLAPVGGKFVVVDTTVENAGKVSMDLTCNFPIVARVIDEADRQFDRIDDIFRVEGNPGCNKNLQPGFSAPMKWVFELPTSATPSLFGFYTPGTQPIDDTKFIRLDEAQP